MPANTTRLALPYPLPDDTTDVPRDVKALAEKVDTEARPILVTSLPGSPVDGQEVYYVADSAAGVIWHLRYRAAAPGASKWEFVGGPSLHDYSNTTAGPWPGSTYNLLATPILVAPLSGEYRVRYDGDIGSTISTAYAWQYAVSINGSVVPVPHSEAVAAGPNPAGSAVGHSLSKAPDPIVLAAGATVQLLGYNSGGSGISNRRSIELLPVRVG